MILWRISNHLSLTGDGALRASGRWHTRGRRVVYCAQNPAAALLEVLVHFEIEITQLPARYRLLKLEAADDLAVARLALADLPTDWIEKVSATQASYARRCILLRTDGGWLCLHRHASNGD